MEKKRERLGLCPYFIEFWLILFNVFWQFYRSWTLQGLIIIDRHCLSEICSIIIEKCALLVSLLMAMSFNGKKVIVTSNEGRTWWKATICRASSSSSSSRIHQQQVYFLATYRQYYSTYLLNGIRVWVWV